MQVAIRSYLIAGMSAVTASAIALTPVSAPPEIHISSPAVSLAASPIDTYALVLQQALTNSGELLQAFLADPAPVLTQVATNQLASFGVLAETFGTYAQTSVALLTTVVPSLLQQATNQLLAGNVEGAINSLQTAGLATLSPILQLPAPITAVLTQPVQNMINVISALTDPNTVGIIGLGLIGPGVSAIGATGTAIQNVLNAVGSGDLVQVFNAIATAPATIADGFLNGGYGPDLGSLVGSPVAVYAGGLLSSRRVEPGVPPTVFAPGPIAAFGEVKDIIAGALVPVGQVPAPASASAAPENRVVHISLADSTDTNTATDTSTNTATGTSTDAETDGAAQEVKTPVKSAPKAIKSHATADTDASSAKPKKPSAASAEKSPAKAARSASSGADN